MKTPTTPYKWKDSDYVKWSEDKLNEYLKTSLLNPLKNCTKVNRYTRASRTHGKFIICPECNQGSYVFHFSWSALGCQHCGTMVDKYDWKLL